MVTPVLPDSARAVIDDQKVSGYLLNRDHPGNGGKAAAIRNGVSFPEGEPLMLKELDRVVLTAPLAAEGLERGDVGTIVLVYRDGEAFEVEFVTLDGETAAVATVEATNVRPVGPREIVHARQLTAR